MFSSHLSSEQSDAEHCKERENVAMPLVLLIRDLGAKKPIRILPRSPCPPMRIVIDVRKFLERRTTHWSLENLRRRKAILPRARQRMKCCILRPILARSRSQSPRPSTEGSVARLNHHHYHRIPPPHRQRQRKQKLKEREHGEAALRFLIGNTWLRLPRYNNDKSWSGFHLSVSHSSTNRELLKSS